MGVIDHLNLREREDFNNLEPVCNYLKRCSETRCARIMRKALQEKKLLDDNGHVLGWPEHKMPDRPIWTRWICYFLCEELLEIGESVDRASFRKWLGKCKWLENSLVCSLEKKLSDLGLIQLRSKGLEVVRVELDFTDSCCFCGVPSIFAKLPRGV